MENVTNGMFMDRIGQYFGVHQDNKEVELETWTEGNVNMFVCLVEEGEYSLCEQFKKRVETYDIDEEVENHRQDSNYRDTFTITESVKDFTTHKEWLENVLNSVSRPAFEKVDIQLTARKFLLEAEMEQFLKAEGYDIYDDHGVIDKKNIVDLAVEKLGYHSYKLDGMHELNQTLIFIK